MPAPLPKWYKWGVKGSGYLWGIAEELLDYNGNVEDESELQWRRLTVEWQRSTPVGTSEDHAFITLDFVNITGGQIDTSWVTADYTAVETALLTWLNVIKTAQTGEHVATAAKWYQMQFANPMTSQRRFVPTGPPKRIYPLNVAGTVAAPPMPYQVALSVTERTAIPKHWGRFYLPGMSHGSLATSSRWGSATVDAIANATSTFYDTCQTAEIFPVVVSTQSEAATGGTQLQGTLLGVQHVQVDDIPDVVRRRRPRNTTYRKIVPPLPAPS